MSLTTGVSTVKLPPSEDFGDLSATVELTLDDGDSISAVSVSASWITATIGGLITVDENAGDDEEDDDEDSSEDAVVSSSRTGTVTWTTTNGDVATVTVLQYGEVWFSDGEETLNLDNSAQTVELPTATYEADSTLSVTPYSVDQEEGIADWLEIDEDAWTVSVQDNSGAGRTETLSLVFCVGDEMLGFVSCTIVQSSGEESLTLSGSGLTFTYSGGIGNVSFSTTGGENISSCSCSVDWVTVTYDSAADDDGNYSGTITVTVSSNAYGVKRTATVTVVGALYSAATITVTQDEGPYFITLSSEAVELDCGANSEIVKITDTGDSVTLPLTASYDDASDWLAVVVAETTITIYATANTDSSSRTATVTLTGGNASVTLTVVQAGAPSRENLRLIPMQCGDDESYVLLFRDNPDETACMLDIYDAKTRKLYQTIDETPFPAGSEREIRYIQSFDVVYFAQGQTYPCKLVRDTNDDAGDGEGEYVFSFEDAEFLVQPLLEWDIYSEHTIKVFAQEDSALLEGSYYPKGSVRVDDEDEDRTLYIAIQDAPTGIAFPNTDYYHVFSGAGSGLLMTIDGSNTNENLVIGQWIAIKYTNKVYDSQLWDYDSYPEGTSTDANTSYPEVETLDPLDSKTDQEGNELRPDTGGGYGFSSEWFPVRGEVTLKTEGTWSGVIELQEKDDDGNVFTIGKITSENGLSNTELTREVDEFGHAVRVACTRREKAYQTQAAIYGTHSDEVQYVITECDEGLQWTLESSDIQNVYIKVTGKTTLDDGTGVYIVDVESGMTHECESTSYALGAWSTANGYPEHLTIYQERLVYACNVQKPTTLWLSKTNHWDDFESGTDDTSAMNYTMQTDKYDRVRWLLALKSAIAIGTDYGEWQFGEAGGGVVTVDNGRFINTSSIGSAEGLPAVVLGGALIMVKTGAKKVHRCDYNTLSEESAGTQLSLLSSHLFDDDEIVDMMVVRAPTNTMYCLHDSGKLTSFTYEPEYDVAGWAQHSVLDGVVCACVVRRSGTDVLVMIAEKDGSYLLGEIDSESEVYLDDGESYTSELIPTPFAVNQQTGAYGSRNVFAGVDVYLTEGTQFEVCLPGGNWTHVEVGYNTDNTLPAFDLQKVTIPVSAGWEDEAVIDVRTDYAGPFVVAGIGVNIRKGK